MIEYQVVIHGAESAVRFIGKRSARAPTHRAPSVPEQPGMY